MPGSPHAAPYSPRCPGSGSARAAARSRSPRRVWWPTRSSARRRGRAGADPTSAATSARVTTSRASSRRSRRRCSRRRWTWPCTPPRTCRASCRTAWRSWAVPERADPRDALCGAASLDDLPEGATVGTEQPAPARSAARRTAGPATSRTCAATWTPGCAGSPTATTTRIVLAAAGLARLGRAGEGTPAGRADSARARPGLPRPRGARRRRADRRARRAVTDRDALAACCGARLAVSPGRGLPHADRGHAQLTATTLPWTPSWAMPDGSALDPRRADRRGGIGLPGVVGVAARRARRLPRRSGRARAGGAPRACSRWRRRACSPRSRR